MRKTTLDYTILSDRIRTIMRLFGIHPVRLIKRAGLTAEEARCVLGGRRFGLDVLARVCRVLGVGAGVILDR